ncbi:ABC transporter ATP-binding protein (plasmid) [Rhizobium leguminosarum bv. viciae 248]|uniref:ABC transporter ATP-binding protein n=1 Tax=Rhizobium leguminosarum TaxID=384 RepID=UPI0003AACEC3|nr:ABC transporter ATP-binding protein [Rhizobium leguminosarum]MBY5835800.1 ABC transporter ATP-binding protein [Rhizobium leguminosarum]MCA2407210.1 ABC transporter ATP-binding protein/permease [Rhizobium leguminosarum]NKM60915.1 ATP-binding cassette domain-containing protein [Rhizobium leguminosarum bv. viciae]NKM80607.1 ATP-binding cassette domain-containing protein [Rhizobium leguminosarum bv. viciae]QHW28298.1 ABC transporter ATP-binding protein [Rhizobium leguminosarum bv. viciae 248]
MAEELETERPDVREDGRRPPRAVVGSHRVEEEMFGKAFDGNIVKRIWVFVHPYRRQVLWSVVAVLTFTMMQLTIPLIIRYAIDHGMSPGGDHSALVWSIVAFTIAISINYAASYAQETLVGGVAEDVLFDIRKAMFSHLQRVSLSFMDKTEVGRLMSRLQGDVNSMQEFLETSVLSVGDIVLLFGIVFVMLYLDFKLGLLTLSVLPVLFIVRLFWLPLARKSFMAAHETNSVANGALAEAIHGVRAVQSMDRQGVNFTLYDDKAHANLKTHLTAARYAQVMVPIVDSLTGVAMALVIVVGGARVLNQALDVGVLVAFLFYIQRFFDPIRSLTLQYSVMQRAMASGQRLTEVLDVPVDIKDAPDAKVLSRDMDGSVEFKDVVFGYNPKHPVLKHVSFKVNPGETVALVGPTGSGKSSCMSLIHRFYDVQQGQVLVGGDDVRDLTQDSLGAEIAMVLQEPFLFTGTVFENIRYRKLEATREQVIEAAKAVGAHDFVMRLPDGYDSVLGERGGNLSLGQRQLLSFARALVADAKILVLDEATANIDSYTEMLIQKALVKLLENRTGLVIAHRLATIREADRIIVLQNGEIIESGDHRQLMKNGKLYSKLYNLNYSSFDDIPEDVLEETTAAESAT